VAVVKFQASDPLLLLHLPCCSVLKETLSLAAYSDSRKTPPGDIAHVICSLPWR